MQITCHECGEKFVCGVNDNRCWCFDLPKIKISKNNACLCKKCLLNYIIKNGESLDGIGHVPDVYIKNSKEDIENDKDLVLERAILYLKEEYGIE